MTSLATNAAKALGALGSARRGAASAEGVTARILAAVRGNKAALDRIPKVAEELKKGAVIVGRSVTKTGRIEVKVRQANGKTKSVYLGLEDLKGANPNVSNAIIAGLEKDGKSLNELMQGANRRNVVDSLMRTQLRRGAGSVGRAVVDDTKNLVSDYPVRGGLLAAGAGLFVADEVVGPVAGAVGDVLTGRPVDEAEAALAEFREEAFRDAAAQKRISEEAENSARLATLRPDLYNQVLAGRRLPRGTTVIGGKPRVNELQQLAALMADGAFSPTGN